MGRGALLLSCLAWTGCGRIDFAPFPIDSNNDGNTVDSLVLGGSLLGTIGGAGIQSVKELTIDAAGAITVVGKTTAPLTLDGTLLPYAGDSDFFVAHTAPHGELLWAHAFGGAGRDTAFSVGAGTQGDLYVTGLFSGTLDLGTGPLVAQDEDIHLERFTDAGAIQWARRYGAMATLTPYGTDAGDEVVARGDLLVVAGTCKGPVDFGTGPLCGQDTATDGYDAFVVGLGTDASPRWAHKIGGTRFNLPYDLAIDSSRVYVTGFYEGQPDLGGGLATAYRGIQDGFVSVFDHSGAFVWSSDFGGNDFDWPLGIATDASGNLYVAGYFTSTDFVIGGTPLTAVGGGDAFLASFTPSGVLRWARRFGAAGCDRFTSVAALPSGAIAIGGVFSGTVDFGTGPVTAQDEDGVLVVMTPDGQTTLSTRAIGASGYDELTAVEAGVDALIAIGGSVAQDSSACGGTSTTGDAYFDLVPP